MRKEIEYEKDRPLMRLEQGDKAIITVNHSLFTNDKERRKYGDIPEGTYSAEVVGSYTLKCIDQPRISGKYAMWYGNKIGCTGIHGDEAD